MKTVMYVHGYGSNGNATKGQILRQMLPQCRVISPTFDYDNLTPWQIQEQLRTTVESEHVSMLVGSSFGGYHSLCATSFFHGTVWAVNPVHDVAQTIRRVVQKKEGNLDPSDFIALYEDFDRQVFQEQSRKNRSGEWTSDTPLHFALSLDDELLGDHTPLLQLFPQHCPVVWKDNSGHRFLRFNELEIVD